MRALIQLVPRPAMEQAFDGALRAVARELRERPDAGGLVVNALLRLENDPFGARTPYRGTLEIAGETAGARTLEALAAGLVGRLADVVRADASTLLIGEDRVCTALGRAPVRYQYLMRRNARFTHDAYLERYREIHSRFGLATPGTLGYVQSHVDPVASRNAADRSGLGVWDVDSVSELHLVSLESFLGVVARSPLGAEAIADEEVFVDRANSHDFCSVVEWQEPPSG